MLKSFDVWLFTPAFLLSLLGLLIIFSFSSQAFGDQFIFLIIALGLFILVLFLDIHVFQAFAWILYGLSNLLLAATFIFGVATRGSTRWLDLGFLRFQPSEVIKPFLAIAFAFFAVHLEIRKNFKDFLIFSGLFGLPFLLIFFQPDLGTTLALTSLWGGIVLTRGLNLRMGFLLLISSLILIPLVWGLLKPYQKQRFQTFIHPLTDPLGASYNQIQAVIAVGSGGFLGRGLGSGSQSYLKFLPEQETDFIFATFAEELGFLGSFLLLILYGLLFARLLYLAKKTNCEYSRLVIMAIFSFLFFQTGVHMAINLGLLPVTGITLPFISMGGSSLVSSWLSLGVVMAASKIDDQKSILEIS